LKTEGGMKERLQAFIGKQEGFENWRVESLYRMPGGASKETWSFDLVSTDESAREVLPMVLRINRSSPLPVSIDLKQEFLLMKEVYEEGIEVPKPYWYGEKELGNPFYVIGRIEGETIVRRLHRDDEYETARRVIPAQMGRILAKIHRIRLNGNRFNFLPHRIQSGSFALGELSFYETMLHRYAPDPHPALELGIRWLGAHLPSTIGPSLVHGDYRLGNIIFTREGVRTVLDWELSHVGDPMEDLGYITIQAWRFGNDSLPIGGVGRREEFYEAYERGGGFPVDRKRMGFWEVFGNLKWAVITILQMVPFLDGSSESIELASLGRKTSEVELQLISLIEGG